MSGPPPFLGPQMAVQTGGAVGQPLRQQQEILALMMQAANQASSTQLVAATLPLQDNSRAQLPPFLMPTAGSPSQPTSQPTSQVTSQPTSQEEVAVIDPPRPAAAAASPDTSVAASSNTISSGEAPTALEPREQAQYDRICARHEALLKIKDSYDKPEWCCFRLYDMKELSRTRKMSLADKNAVYAVCMECHPDKSRDAHEEVFITCSNPTNVKGYFKIVRGETGAARRHATQAHSEVIALYSAELTRLGKKPGKKRNLTVGSRQSMLGQFIPDSKRIRLTQAGGMQRVVKLSRLSPDQIAFVKDLVLRCAKCYLPMSIVANPWDQRVYLRQNPHLNTVTPQDMTKKHIPEMVGQVDDEYVQPWCDAAIAVWYGIDLWMTQKSGELMGLLAHAIVKEMKEGDRTVYGRGERKRGTRDLKCLSFHETKGNQMAPVVKKRLQKRRLTTKSAGIVYDGGKNLHALRDCIKAACCAKKLGLKQLLEGFCYFHAASGGIGAALSKDVDDAMKALGFRSSCTIAEAQKNFQPVVTLSKKSGPAARMLSESQAELNHPKQALPTPCRTRPASKVVFYSVLSANRMPITNMFTTKVASKFRDRNPRDDSWMVASTVEETLSKFVANMVKVQGRGYWDLPYAMDCLVFLYIECKNGCIGQPTHSWGAARCLQHFMLLEMKKKLEPFLEPLRVVSESSPQYVLSLLLNPMFADVECLVKLNGQEEGQKLQDAYVEILVNCMVESYKAKHEVVDANQPAQSRVTRGLQPSILKGSADAGSLRREQEEQLSRYFNYCNNPANWMPTADETGFVPPFDCLAWWDKHEHLFPQVAECHDCFNACPASEAEVEVLFSTAGVLLSDRRKRMEMSSLANLLFINKNFPNDPTVGFEVGEKFLGLSVQVPTLSTLEQHILNETEIQEANEAEVNELDEFNLEDDAYGSDCGSDDGMAAGEVAAGEVVDWQMYIEDQELDEEPEFKAK